MTIIILHAMPALASDSLPDLLSRIRERQGFWIAYRAQVTARFSAAGKEAVCRGELNYHRLDEKILFRCSGENQNLLFIFRAEDRAFELYLASARRVYSGHILDVENAPGIESALKPLALYRALKSMAVPAAEAEIVKEKDQTWIRIHTTRRGHKRLVREIEVTPEGDVPYEVYYSEEAQPATVIERADFRKEERRDRTRSKPVMLPRSILIRDFSAASSGSVAITDGAENRQEGRTELIFESVRLDDAPAADLWRADWPADAEKVSL